MKFFNSETMPQTVRFTLRIIFCILQPTFPGLSLWNLPRYGLDFKVVQSLS